MKPVIRLSLIPSVHSYPCIDDIYTVRVDGTDTWMAKLSYCTDQGQHTQKTFAGFNKREVLEKAYDCLRELSVEEWYPKFFNEQLAIYCDYFTPENRLEERFGESMCKVRDGAYTCDRFIEIWQERLRFYNEQVKHQNTVHVGNSNTRGTYDPRMDERCDPVDTKRWWQFWK